MDRKRFFLVYLIVFAVVLIANGAFLVWFYADTTVSLATVSTSSVLQYLTLVSTPLAEFSAGALVVAAFVLWRDPELSGAVRIVLRVISLLMLLLAVASPLVASGLPDVVRTLFAVAVIISIKLPVTYVVVGGLLSLSLARTSVPRPKVDLNADPFDEGE